MSAEHRFDLTWKALPTDLFTSQSKGSKAEARKEWDKLKLDDEAYKNITEFLKDKEHIDRDKRKTGGFTSNWPHFCRMLKRRFWEDDLPKVSRKKTASEGKCRNCSGPMDHAVYQLCWTCYDKKYGSTLAGWYQPTKGDNHGNAQGTRSGAEPGRNGTEIPQ